MTRERPRRASSARECSHALPRFDRDLQPIPERREGTHPLWVVAARRVVREVEVEYQLVTDCPEVRALRRVEKIAAAAVRRIAGGRVAEWEEDPAAVRVEPENFERTDDDLVLAVDDDRYVTLRLADVALGARPEIRGLLVGVNAAFLRLLEQQADRGGLGIGIDGARRRAEIGADLVAERDLHSRLA